MPLTRKLASKSLIKQNTNQDVIGTGVTNLVRDAFTGTGSQTVFTLSVAPLSAANTQVFISGVYQNKNTYTISGTTLTFSTPPPNATNIEVISGTNYSIGVPGDQAVTLSKLAVAVAEALNPTGTVLSYAGTAAPSGYLSCDGTSYPTASYPALFAVLGYSHGGSGSNFNVPDYRGRFLRGVDGAASRDPNSSTRTAMNTGGNTGNAVGSVQSAQLGDHTHTEGTLTANINHNSGNIYAQEVTAPASYTSNYNSTIAGSFASVTQTDGVKVQGTTATNASPTTETRPLNAYVNYIIKY